MTPVRIGQIVITYELDDTHGPVVSFETPGFDDVPLVIQLGMLELVRDTLLRHGRP